MPHDKGTAILVEALKQALAEPREQRLYRSGKLAGLFAGRTGANAEAAARALRDGLLEVVRTEVKGRVTIDWVRPTPQAVDFVLAQESPVRALRDFQATLQVTRDRLPDWLADMRRQLQELSDHLGEEFRRWTHRLDTLSLRVEEALRRAEAGESPKANGQPGAWAADALAYLDRRRQGGAGDHCPLPELFAALRRDHAGLSMKAFHEGLRRLHDRRALRLVPFAGLPTELPEPEYALLDGATVLYYVAR